MALRSFLSDLHEHGRVKVASPERGGTDTIGADAVLLELDRHARLELALDAPPFRPAIAMWGALQLYRDCQRFLFREPYSPNDAPRVMESCPEPISPAVVYSVDLTLRFLPELVAMARAAVGHETLVADLSKLAEAWPLSSVGIQGLGVVTVDAFMDHPGLRQLYVDRIIARHDTTRLSDPRVREATRAAIGIFPALAPEIASLLDADHA